MSELHILITSHICAVPLLQAPTTNAHAIAVSDTAWVCGEHELGSDAIAVEYAVPATTIGVCSVVSRLAVLLWKAVYP